ncbi:hypothetical protein CTAM01_06228 [Colletotrichum tamarilloi]|uniref:Uncharacterized protein n=1 Tax=Colletotrichum tamarilloi TaxID=1209934 RepID=A0ABQ9RC67_9PEZI|nr:uncharacterized protein CTAM01_06228 [Colletotrichum tamarilloi]KAK1500776.1 hypothetical protein CTAM01_06228 [Colletotrichum tamarilloi]
MRPAAGSASIRLFFYHQKNLSTAPVCFPTPGGGPPSAPVGHTPSSRPRHGHAPCCPPPAFASRASFRVCLCFFNPCLVAGYTFIFRAAVSCTEQVLWYERLVGAREHKPLQACLRPVLACQGSSGHSALLSVPGHVPVCMTRRRQVTPLGLRSDGCWCVCECACACPRTMNSRRTEEENASQARSCRPTCHACSGYFGRASHSIPPSLFLAGPAAVT